MIYFTKNTVAWYQLGKRTGKINKQTFTLPTLEIKPK